MNGWVRFFCFTQYQYKDGKPNINIVSKCYCGWFQAQKRHGYGVQLANYDVVNQGFFKDDKYTGEDANKKTDLN